MIEWCFNSEVFSVLYSGKQCNANNNKYVLFSRMYCLMVEEVNMEKANVHWIYWVCWNLHCEVIIVSLWRILIAICLEWFKNKKTFKRYIAFQNIWWSYWNLVVNCELRSLAAWKVISVMWIALALGISDMKGFLNVKKMS